MTHSQGVAMPMPPTDKATAEALALELFIAGYEGTSLPERYAERLRRGLAGIILFSRNLEQTPDGSIALQSLVDQTHAIHHAASAASDLPAICAVDQEGGLVARLRAPFTHLPPMSELGLRDDPELTRRAGAQTGRECLAAGFNVDFAPILDIDTNPDNPIIGKRAFGPTPEIVIRHAGAFLDGLQSTGCLGSGKHFPGHGDTDVDSHLALPCLPFDQARLEAVELAPFKTLAARMSLVMTAHILFPALDETLPATLSRPILQSLLRGVCAFEGVIVSDDLEMKGVAEAFSFSKATRLGLEAGVQLFLVCRREDALDEAADEVVSMLLSGGPSADTVLAAVSEVRALRAKLTRPTPSKGAIAAATGDLEALRLREILGIGTV